jgi:hypothetical protein
MIGGLEMARAGDEEKTSKLTTSRNKNNPTGRFTRVCFIIGSPELSAFIREERLVASTIAYSQWNKANIGKDLESILS